jgi:hypothetical protein
MIPLIMRDPLNGRIEDPAQTIRGRFGMPAPVFTPSEVMPLLYNAIIAALNKIIRRRYFQDMGHFLKRRLQKRI